MATITEVAKAANVSAMTVSRVLNNSGYVKKETRLAIEKAIKELDYRPNLVAKSLVTGKSSIIAYVLADISDQFYGNVCKGVEQACIERGYTAVICNAGAHTSVDSYIRMIIDRKFDGVIFHHLSIDQEQIQLLQKAGVHCVTVDNENILSDVSCVDSDDYWGAVKAVRYLYEKGYRKIGCISGEDPELPEEHKCYQERYQHRIWENRTKGYFAGLEACGLESAGVFSGRGSADVHISFECGRKIAGQLMERGDVPEALYCQSDVMALGVMNRLSESCQKFSEQVGIIGHDGLDMCRLTYPSMTTVVQPKYEMGMMAANMLLDRISQEDMPVEHKIMDSYVYIGKTTR